VIDIASGESHLPAPIDRCFSKPHWSKDGRSIYTLIEQSRVTRLSRIDLSSGKLTPLSPDLRFDYDLDVKGERVVVLGGDDQNPYEISALERGSLRPLTHHNDWLSERRLARTEPVRFVSADGTAIEGLLTLPLDHQNGQPAPLIVRLHGGPVYQFSHEFMPDWQIYAPTVTPCSGSIRAAVQGAASTSAGRSTPTGVVWMSLM
jgi:dipeptidyl aminopeptidase/acylaminoacyl peptidase